MNEMPPFVWAGGQWFIVVDWEPGFPVGPCAIRPLSPAETTILNDYIENFTVEAWAVISVLKQS